MREYASRIGETARTEMRHRSVAAAIGMIPLVVGLALLSACASTTTWPRVVQAGGGGGPAPLRGEWIDNYDQALASIGVVMTDQLGLPPARAALYFHRDREAFQAALEADGYPPEFAEQTASVLIAVSGHERVVINDRALEEVDWLFRVALLAHELTHTLQYEFAGGKRGTSDQWLREGFAEWVEVEVLVRLGFTTRPAAQRVLRTRLLDARADRWPPLSEMVTFPQWVALAEQVGQEALYGYAAIATDHLLERHDLATVINYFRLFAKSDDRLENFRRAFGYDLAEFERSFTERLRALLR